MKTSSLLLIDSVRISRAFKVPAKSSVVRVFDVPPGAPLLVLVQGMHHDVSNSFNVRLESEDAIHFQGQLGVLYEVCQRMEADGFLLSGLSFTLTVENPFEHDLICPRLRFSFSNKRST